MNPNSGTPPPMAPIVLDAEPPPWLDQDEPLIVDFTEYWVEEEVRFDLSGRMVGCQSNHSGPCYGELWHCAECRKTVCFADGTDNHPELCDVCWYKRYAEQKEADDVQL